MDAKMKEQAENALEENSDEVIKNVDKSEADVCYVKLINGENLVGYVVDSNDDGIWLGDVLQYVSALGQFVPYQPFLGKDEYYFDFSYTMGIEWFEDGVSKLYRDAVYAYQNPPEEESGLVGVGEKKIITH